jgi:hypothetical protein
MLFAVRWRNEKRAASTAALFPCHRFELLLIIRVTVGEDERQDGRAFLANGV